jgi:hypothetical protein
VNVWIFGDDVTPGLGKITECIPYVRQDQVPHIQYTSQANIRNNALTKRSIIVLYYMTDSLNLNRINKHR